MSATPYTPAEVRRWLDGVAFDGTTAEIITVTEADAAMARQIKATLFPDLAGRAARMVDDAAALAEAAKRLSELQAACADLHQWAQDNSIGDLPELQARIARVRAALGN